MQKVYPTSAKVPAGQSEQPVEGALLYTLLAVPAAQGKHSAVPIFK